MKESFTNKSFSMIQRNLFSECKDEFSISAFQPNYFLWFIWFLSVGRAIRTSHFVLAFLCTLNINCWLFFISNEKGNSLYLWLYRRHFHQSTHASRSIFCIHFCKFLINYVIKIIYFPPNISKRKKIRILY